MGKAGCCWLLLAAAWWADGKQASKQAAKKQGLRVVRAQAADNDARAGASGVEISLSRKGKSTVLAVCHWSGCKLCWSVLA